MTEVSARKLAADRAWCTTLIVLGSIVELVWALPSIALLFSIDGGISGNLTSILMLGLFIVIVIAPPTGLILAITHASKNLRLKTGRAWVGVLWYSLIPIVVPFIGVSILVLRQLRVTE